tara:strand:+ start:208 stop:417 length:210 start_codon:yes stop_codon:yes gene_type:complete
MMIVFEEELPLNHEPSLDHWAKALADCDVATGQTLNWDHAYEESWRWLDGEYNYNYAYIMEMTNEILCV